LFQIARLPDEAFQPGVFKTVFTFVIPMLLVSNVPVRLLVNKMEQPSSMLLLMGMCGLCLLVSEWGWRQSLKRYTSASS
jgi:ABC-2 type transport system permease protein